MKSRITEAEFDELKVEGVRSRGFGQLPKVLMLDADLSLNAKGVAAYFYSYTGGGSTSAFPSRSRILADLGISKDLYYACLRELTEQGYLTVERKRRKSEKGFSHNVYTLVSFPDKYRELTADSDYLRKLISIVRNRHDLNAGGYGNVPKLVMTDGGLSLASKALYALMCSFSGESGIALPDQKSVLYYTRISEATYVRRMRELEEAGLICRRPRRMGGRFVGTEVLLCDYPGRTEFEDNPCLPEVKTKRKPQSVPHRQNQDKQETGYTAPYRQNQDKQASPYRQIPDMQNQDKQTSPHRQISDIQIPDVQISDVQDQDTNIPNVRTITNFTTTSFHHSPSADGKNAASEAENVREGEKDDTGLINEIVAEGTLVRCQGLAFQ